MSFKRALLVPLVLILVLFPVLFNAFFPKDDVQYYYHRGQNCSQYGFRFDFHHYWGFGSEVNNMLNAALYAEYLNRTFYITSHVWNYGRWSDYFEKPTQCAYDRYARAVSKYPEENVEYRGNLYASKAVYSGLNIALGEARIDPMFDAKRKIAKKIWKLNESTQKYVDSFVERVLPSPTQKGDSLLVGMHIRRGDKQSETEILGVEHYISKAQELAGDREIKYYVASDDIESVIQEINEIDEESDVFYDDQVNHKGHDQAKFNKLSKEERKNEALELISSLEGFLKCDIIICTFSSNICRLLAILSEKDNVYSVDRDWFYQ
eukprot:TRINITY_DN1130_c0_g1_i3.p1 TRINITY_DN1130_c0_g1~~TRINITY_DN1130_c0_g1_i3.p1  ORF type:complete len:321 (-),score=63.71 TRINITY_DN1130_c0_g1_i3:513-1475(-)